MTVAAQPRRRRAARPAALERRSLASRGVVELASEGSLDVNVLHVLGETSRPAFTDRREELVPQVGHEVDADPW